MERWIPALAAFALGVLTAYVNSRITKAALNKGKNPAAILPLRTLVSAGFIIIVFLISEKLKLDITYTLIGAALGATLGLIVFTVRLMPGIIGAQGGEEGKENEDG